MERAPTSLLRGLIGDKILSLAAVQGISVTVFREEHDRKAIFRKGQVNNGILY